MAGQSSGSVPPCAFEESWKVFPVACPPCRNSPHRKHSKPDSTRATAVFDRLLKNRVIMLGSDVNDDIANQICAQLLYLEGEDPNADIWLYVNSPGGSVTAGMAIYDTMQFVGCDVATVCLGLAASMGQFLLTAGAAGKRYVLPNARVMMHQPLAGLRGQASDIQIQAEQLRYTKKRMAELIAFHSGQTLEQIQADSERDRWFTAEEAKDYGLCDSVILNVAARSTDATPVADRSRASASRSSGVVQPSCATIVKTGPMSTAQLRISQRSTAAADFSVEKIAAECDLFGLRRRRARRCSPSRTRR